MAQVTLKAARIAGIATAVPARRFDNIKDTTAFSQAEVQKVTKMAGVVARHVADETICSTDLCDAAARRLLGAIGWEPASVDALIFVTQTPDYLLPSSACMMQQRLALSDRCAAFDVGLGCSGYPYGLWLATLMLQNSGMRRVLLCHGETPTRFTLEADRSVALLFGDAGSATALESSATDGAWHFVLQTDGAGYKDLIIQGGGFRNRFPTDRRLHYVEMQGSNIFNFTLQRVPALIEDSLTLSGLARDQLDYYIFHQSNQFIMKHLMQKAGLAPARVPLILHEYGNTGGPSVPLTITQGGLVRPADRALRLMLLGYGVGLSWGSAVVDLPPDAALSHVILESGKSADG
jgi:3-oxoacyl-[acyl-carrier-protein] synthase-3